MGKGSKMFKLEIPRKYLQMFEMSELEEITVHVDKTLYRFNKHNFEDNRKEWDFKSSFYPDSWYKEIPEPQEDYVKKLLEHNKKMGALSIVIKTTKDDIKVFHSMYGRKIIEVDRSMATAVCNLESRLQHVHNNWGIVNYQLMDLCVYDIDVFDELNRYYIYSKNWLDEAGSSGGGNITGALTTDELNKRLGTLQTYEKVGPKNYRLTQQFIEGMGRIL